MATTSRRLGWPASCALLIMMLIAASCGGSPRSEVAADGEAPISVSAYYPPAKSMKELADQGATLVVGSIVGAAEGAWTEPGDPEDPHSARIQYSFLVLDVQQVLFGESLTEEEQLRLLVPEVLLVDGEPPRDAVDAREEVALLSPSTEAGSRGLFVISPAEEAGTYFLYGRNPAVAVRDDRSLAGRITDNGPASLDRLIEEAEEIRRSKPTESATR